MMGEGERRQSKVRGGAGCRMKGGKLTSTVAGVSPPVELCVCACMCACVCVCVCVW